MEEKLTINDSSYPLPSNFDTDRDALMVTQCVHLVTSICNSFDRFTELHIDYTE